MLSTQATPERVAELEAELGLDRPFAVRYLEWLAGFFTGDLGISYSYSQPVWELIAPKVGITLCLSLLSFALIAVVSIPLGLWASRGHSRVGDAVGTVLDQLCMAVPPFFTSRSTANSRIWVRTRPGRSGICFSRLRPSPSPGSP